MRNPVVHARELVQVAAPALGFTERLVRAQLGGLASGELELEQDGRRRTYGAPATDGLAARAVVVRPRVWRRIALGGTLGAAEAFVDGDWTTDDVTSAVRVMLRNRAVLDGIDGGVRKVGRLAAAVQHALRANTPRNARQNIEAHYDLGNNFFAAMLDPTMTYSAAIFEPGDTLEAASVRKLELLCEKLGLSSRDHLLEIGTGWGSLAIHAARTRGCRVTTTTISPSQARLARERIAAAGLTDRITVLERDYRALTGRYDHIVSCEMIEAVGWEYVPTFFASCAGLLAPNGRLAMQAITIPDAEEARARGEVDFIKAHIFPGSSIPSVTSLCTAAARASDLRLRALTDHTPHYATTLAAWRTNLAPHRAAVIARYGERFWRLWSFYLGYCEAGYRERYLGSVQLLFERP